MARPRFYAIDDLENQETETHDDTNSFSQASKACNNEQITCHQRDKQQRLEPKNSIQFKNVVVVDKPAMSEKLEEMRRLLTTIRRRVSIQYPGHSMH